jgi:Trk K+ transport system NAD-binding subunit
MDFGITSVQISSCSCHCGKALTSLQLPEKCLIIGIIRQQQVILTSAEPTIWTGDYILAVALNSAFVPMLNFTLKKRHPVHYSPPKCLIKKSTNIY